MSTEVTKSYQVSKIAVLTTRSDNKASFLSSLTTFGEELVLKKSRFGNSRREVHAEP